MTVPKALKMRRSIAPGVSGPSQTEQFTLAGVDVALAKNDGLSPIRRRDLRSAIRRVARLLGDEPAQIPLDLSAISTRLAACMPAAAGLSDKSFANLKSDFLAAVRASALRPIHSSAKTSLTSGWRTLMPDLPSQRMRLGISRLARWCSAKGIEPEAVNDLILADFIAAVRAGTLHRKPNDLYRSISKIWNEIGQFLPARKLQRVSAPSFRKPARRLDWSVLPQSFRDDLDAYGSWSAGSDPFAADARSRALAPQTIKLQRNHVLAALTSLVESGVSPGAINSLADVVTVENFRRILGRRHEMVEGRENVFNRDLARTLTEIARLWVKVDDMRLAELKRLAGKVPVPVPGLTEKNKARLRQFDDPTNLLRLVDLPNRLWAEVKRDKKPSMRTVLKAQAALAIAILTWMPVRPQNLWALKFEEHIFIHEGYGAISSLEFSANEVKNEMEIAFDIPPHITKMLVEYRDRLVPKVIGKRSDRLFIKADGSAKSQWAVAWLIRKVLKRRAGIELSGHQFRHVAAKVVLDPEPGAFETVRQLLAHKSMRTTVMAYAGISSRRAARHHQQLLERVLAQVKPLRG
jgi:integrase